MWEPGAPDFEERIRCLNHAHGKGFKISVSIEPMLDPDNIGELLEDLPIVDLESVWIGKMNHTGRITVENDGCLGKALVKLKESQSDKNILKIYNQWKSEPKIMWKESVQKVVIKSTAN